MVAWAEKARNIEVAGQKIVPEESGVITMTSIYSTAENAYVIGNYRKSIRLDDLIYHY